MNIIAADCSTNHNIFVVIIQVRLSQKKVALQFIIQTSFRYSIYPCMKPRYEMLKALFFSLCVVEDLAKIVIQFIGFYHCICLV